MAWVMQGNIKGPPGTGGTGTSVTRARIRLAADNANSMANAAWTAVTMDTADVDSDGLWSPTTRSRLVIQQTGTYRLEGQLVWNANTTGFRDGAIWKNGVGTGSILGETVVAANPTATNYTIQNVETGPVILNAGDYIELAGYQNSGGALLLRQNVLGSWLGLQRIDQVNYSAGVASGLIGKQSYNPSTLVTVGTTAIVPTDIDATNLKVTFIAPASGQVIVRLTASAWLSAASNGYYWSLASGGVDVAGSKAQVTGSANINRETHEILISGLASGQQYTYTWRHWVQANTVTGSIRYGDDGSVSPYGSAVMEVYDATIGVPNASFPQNGITQPYLGMTSFTGSAAYALTSSSTPSDVNTNGVQVTFIVPASGRVLVSASAVARCDVGSTQLYWQLSDLSNNAVSPANGVLLMVANSLRVTTQWLITGLIPGQQVTWKLRHFSADGVSQVGTYGGDLNHQTQLWVQDAVLSPNMTQQSANPFLLGKTVINGARTAVTTSSTTPVVVDSTNLKVSFLAPASGQVVVRLSGTAYVFSNTANTGGRGHWCLCSDTAGTVVPNTILLVINSPSTAVADQQQSFRLSPEMSVTGLTPGQQYTYYWGHFVDVATTQSYVIYGDNGTTLREGAAVMEVWDGTAGQGTVQTPPGLTTLGRLHVAQSGTTLNVPNTTWTTVNNWAAPTDDPLGGWDATNNQWRVPATGSYLIDASMGWGQITGGIRLVAIYVNAVEIVRNEVYSGSATDNIFNQIVRVMRLNTGDVVQIRVYQSSGATTTATSGLFDIQQLPDTSHAPSATSSSQVIGARISKSANQTLAAANTKYALTFDTLDKDAGGFYSSVSPTRLTVPAGAGGSYRVRAQVTGNIAAAAYVQASILRNGNAAEVVTAFASNATGTQNYMTTTAERLLDLNAGDYVEAYGLVTGTNLQIAGGDNGALTYFEIQRVNSVALTDPTTSKGDLVVRSATGLARQPVGTDGQIQIADSTQALGMRWGPIKVPAVHVIDKSGGGTGQFVTSSTTYADVGLADLVLPNVVAGQIVEVSLSGIANGNGTSVLDVDACTMVGGSRINFISGTTATGAGVLAWMLRGGEYWSASGSILYTLVAGDISGGSVTIRLVYKVESAGTRGFQAGATVPLKFAAVLLG